MIILTILPDIKGSIVNELELLHTHFWGQHLHRARLLKLSTSHPSINPLFIDVLLIRKECHIAYDAVIAKTTPQVGRTIILMKGLHPN